MENEDTVLQTDYNKRLKIIYTGKSLNNRSEYTEIGKTEPVW